MIPATTFAGKIVAVFGLARSGIVSAEALVAGGATVACWDDGEAGRAAAQKAGLSLVDLREADWSKFAALVLAPGVPLTHPKPHWTVEKAKAAGVEIIGDIALFFRERAKQFPPDPDFYERHRLGVYKHCPVVCITGTNGKSTTTALIDHVLRHAGRDSQMGGNIGVAVLALAPITSDRHYVIETSSFQIELSRPLEPTVGIMLNVTPDHLDRHDTLERYAAIKSCVLNENVTFRIVGVDDDISRVMAIDREHDGRHAVICISGQREIAANSLAPHVFVDGGRLCVRGDLLKQLGWSHEMSQITAVGESQPVVEIADLGGIRSLRGAHNGQNAAAAFAALAALLVPTEAIIAGFRSFPGLVHRLEEIGSVGKVVIVNDSKGTNADSTEKALLSFPGDIYWIAGGVPKEGGIEPLRPLFGRIAKAYLIGECAPDFAKTLGAAVAHEIAGDLKTAIANAARDASRSSAVEPVILLSPACASYDQYKSFEQRGDHFKALAAELPGFQPLVSNNGHV